MQEKKKKKPWVTITLSLDTMDTRKEDMSCELWNESES